MRFLQPLPAFILLCLLTACNEQEAILGPVLPVAGPVDFQNPIVGQTNVYDRFDFDCESMIDVPLGYLTLTVTAVTDTELELTERIGQTGPPVVLSTRRAPGNLLMDLNTRLSSELFGFYGSDSLRLDAEPVASLEYRDCRLWDQDIPFTGDYVAEVEELDFFGRRIENMKTVSCVPLGFFNDGINGYLLYDEHNLTASTRAVSSSPGAPTATSSVYMLRED